MLDLAIFTRSRVRLVRQTEVAECGLACLTMIANHHGLDIDLGTMRRRFAPSLRGAALRTLIGLADRIGLVPRAVKLPLEELKNLHVPAVLHWDMNHYVVLEKVSGDKALIHNPEGRSTWMTLDAVSSHFTGVALELRPSDDFETGSQRERLRLSQLWRRMSGLKRALLQVLVLSIVLQAYVLALPYYMQVAIDSALPALDADLLTVLAVGFGLFTLINVGAGLLRSFVLLFAGTTLGFGLASNVARRLFRLPIEWFERRHTGDILSRFQSIAPIQQMLTEGAVAALLDGVLAILTLAVMFFYSPLLALIAIVAFVLYGVVRAVSFNLQKEAQEESIITVSKEQTTLIESLRGMTTLRLFGRETLRHAFWQTRLTDAVNARVRLSRIGIWQTTANTLIFGLENIITIWLAVVASLVTAVGLFGLVTYAVVQRRRELALRLALGARPGEVVRLVTWSGVSMGLMGIVIGLAGAMALSRLIAGFLYGVQPMDLSVYALCAGGVLAVTALAALVPALGARRLAPASVLRED